MECKIYEKKWGGIISERDDENYFRTGRRSGNFYLRHEYDERVPAESSGGKMKKILALLTKIRFLVYLQVL